MDSSEKPNGAAVACALILTLCPTRPADKTTGESLLREWRGPVMLRRMNRFLIVCGVAVCSIVPAGFARIVTVRFTAEVRDVAVSTELVDLSDDGRLIAESFEVGDPIEGIYAYDVSAPDGNADDARGEYVLYARPFGITIRTNHFTFETDPANGGTSILITNDVPFVEGFGDRFEMQCYDGRLMTPQIGDFRCYAMKLRLHGGVNVPLADDSLPSSAPILENWDIRALELGIIGGGRGSVERLDITAVLTSAELLPDRAWVLHVDADAAPGGNGLSWATAYASLQDAIANAATVGNTEIRVAQGIYKPDQGAGRTPGDRLASFELISGLALKGGYAGLAAPDPNARDIELYGTVLSGDLAGNDVQVDDPCDLWREPSRSENAYHVVTTSGTDANTILEGFTITGGNAYEYNWHPQAPNTHNSGGGLRNDGGSLWVRDCTFLRNVAEGEGGGGMFNKDAASTHVIDCEFIENVARGGGGVYNLGGHVAFEDCLWLRNWTPSGGGAMYNHTAKIDCRRCLFERNTDAVHHVEQSQGSLVECQFIENYNGTLIISWRTDIAIIDCIFNENEAGIGGGGGAIIMGSVAKAIIDGCSFAQNRAATGGAMFITQSSYPRLEDAMPITIQNCIFSGNSAVDGGAIYSRFSNTIVTSCTFSGNHADRGTAILSHRGQFEIPGYTEISNCILWDGEDDEIATLDDSPVSVNYSNVSGGRSAVHDPRGVVVWGPGNIDADPLFADPNAADFHLRSQAGRWVPLSQTWIAYDVTSPCVDAGDPASPIGFEPFPNGGRINMGAYGGTGEASKSYFGKPVCETPIAGDINGDCRVDFQDLVLLLSHWLQSGTSDRFQGL
ncbi:MAG: hypothetical protein JW741_10680 [Sedimentisphaerales bacterium]|nr:hypothetical protein [Sedimentisphaerales bacterium]